MDEIECLSVCIPTKDSADHLERCLSSVAPIADEIVILDGGSKDETIKISKKYNANIYTEKEFTGFADLFEELVGYARNDWVFLIDSDEWITKDFRKEIQKKLAEKPYIAYNIWKQNYMYGKKMRIKHKRRPQLAKKDEIKFEGGMIHEKWLVDDGTNVGRFSNPIQHEAYGRVSDHIETIDRYTSLEALKAVEDEPQYMQTFPVYLIKAIVAFVFFYIKERGFLDGYRGFLFSVFAFQYRIVTYAKIKDLERFRDENPQSWHRKWLEMEC